MKSGPVGFLKLNSKAYAICMVTYYCHYLTFKVSYI